MSLILEGLKKKLIAISDDERQIRFDAKSNKWNS